MTDNRFTSRARWCGLVAAITLLAAGCGGVKPPDTPTANTPADEFLFKRAGDSVMRQRWLDARKYYQQIVDNYPQSMFRPDAKLGVGDSYLGEGGEANFVLAENEFKEFITFYPTNMRVDYAQYRLAMSHFMRMRAPERDQTEAIAAVREFEAFFDRYPNSKITSEVREKWRVGRNRLSEASYRVGLYYYRARWYPGAIDRFKAVLKEDPGYPARDAVYYYLAESLLKTDKKAEAVPYYDRLVKEFEQGDFVVEARRRLETLTAQ
jgi:outer membrane protein assembly factor BamD